MNTTQTTGKRQPKYKYVKVIQQLYAGNYGWEDVSEYDSPESKETKELLNHDLKEYHLLCYPTRVITRKVLNTIN